MKTFKPACALKNCKINFSLKIMQFLALLLMGIELGVSYSHLMQMSGKSRLSLTTFITVQNILIKYKVGLGIIETGLLITMVVVLWLCRDKSLIFGLTFSSLLMLIAAFIVWFIFIEPINTAISTWTPSSFPKNWGLYRDRWHLFHIVRLILLAIGTSSLISSVLADRVNRYNKNY